MNSIPSDSTMTPRAALGAVAVALPVLLLAAS